MANGRGKTRLELTWIGKEERPKLEPRILLENPEKSYHASFRRSGDIFDNMLIHGDNLLALKALEADFAGQVKCIAIDPPYNTGAAFEQYDDGIEHSLWLSLMRERLEVLARLLHASGSIWVCIDDNEYAYLRILMDEVFGRDNFVTTIIWEKRKSRENRRVFSFKHDYLVVYARSRKLFETVRNALPPDDVVLSRYKNPDDDPRGPWQSVSANAMAGHATPSQFYTLTAPNGKQHNPPPGRCWTYTKHRMQEEIERGNIWFGKDGNGVPRVKRFLSEQADKGLTPETIWYADDVGTNDSAKKALTESFGGEVVFDTPKPEGLMRRIIQIATNAGDLVLDSFAGSGTTGVVAHKMGRRWIMVELGDHCATVVLPRLRRVLENDGGNQAEDEWQGGGGFRYYRLAPSLLQKDEYGNWIINKDYNAAMLAEALCKIEGFKYDPSPEVYWQQGRSSETDYIFVTTQTMTADMLQKLSDEVSPDRSLLIMCKAFRSKREWPNLTVKKIPKAVLAQCEWGQDDYSLAIKELPIVAYDPEAADDGPQVEPKASGAVKKRRRKAAEVGSGNLFSGDEADGEGE